MTKRRKSEHYYSHGLSKTRIYNIWRKMHERCTNEGHPHYKDYGGKGIRICNEWCGEDGIYNFIKWASKNGYNEKLTLERKDNDLNYCPQNCTWATRKQQANNRSSNKLIEYNGEVHTLSEWGTILNISRSTLGNRLKRGWSVEKSLKTPSLNKINDKNRGIVLVEYNGKEMSVESWARELNIAPTTLRNRLNSGMSVHDAFTKPTRPYNKQVR